MTICVSTFPNQLNMCVDNLFSVGAWALATPIAVNLDGGDRNHLIIGTSMGLVYVLDVQWHSTKSGWPVRKYTLDFTLTSDIFV